MSLVSNNVSITLAKIIGNVILPYTSGTVESRHLDALLVDPEGYQLIVDNQEKILAKGNFKEATELAEQLIG